MLDMLSAFATQQTRFRGTLLVAYIVEYLFPTIGPYRKCKKTQKNTVYSKVKWDVLWLTMYMAILTSGFLYLGL